MKFNRQRLEYFLRRIRSKYADEELSDATLIDELANFMEVNPACVNLNESNRNGRYSYSTVGYGVFSLMGERYRIGRVEIFDDQDESGYAIDEGSYCMPFEAANQFEDFMESLQTDLPIEIKIGSYKKCETECAKDLGLDSVEQMRDPEIIKSFQRKKNDEYAVSQGYNNFDEMLQAIFSKYKK